MAFLGSLLAAAASKAGVAAAGAVLTVTGVGTAAATGNLPADIQAQVDGLIGAERGDDAAEVVGSTEVVENEIEVENELENEVEGETGGGNEVSDAATSAGDGLEGRERGEAISSAVRDANGSADAGQADERRAEAATRADAGRANADAADEAAEPETDPAERQADAADEAAAGQANADAAEGDDDLDDEDEAGDADDERQDGQHRPEGTGAPGSEG